MSISSQSPSKAIIEQDVKRALFEDLSASAFDPSASISELAKNDLTCALIPANHNAKAQIITREDMVLCGTEWSSLCFSMLDSSISLTWHYQDGDKIEANSTLVTMSGNARAILTAERSALNFLQMLSATATTTHRYAQYLSNSNTVLLDTRKTLPSFRQAQKYAVLCGGGQNHRMGVYDAFLIKENHIAACGSIANAVAQAKKNHPNKKVEIEVESLQEFEQALAAKADIVMLDNFSKKQIQEAVSINNQQCKLEVSGNITDQRLAELASLGVDYVSSGAITKHVKAIDLSLLIL